MSRPTYLVALKASSAADPASLEKSRRLEGWHVAFDREDVLVVVKDMPVVQERAEHPTWLAIGHVFDVDRLDGTERANVHAALTRRVWGAYVALARVKGVWSALRDPSGRLQCFSAEHCGWRLFASDMESLEAIGWRSRGLDWNAFAEMLRAPRMRDGRTALSDVVELMPGQAMTASGATSIVWSPRLFASIQIDDVAEARLKLAAAVRKCVEQWAARPTRILHLLSGGLDSSIVLAVLAEAGYANKTRCLNFSGGPGSELDEERFARAVAERFGVGMTTRTFRPRDVCLDGAGIMTTTPRPDAHVFSLESDQFETEAAGAWGADACFSAAGGDGLFYQVRARVYCADYLHRRGLAPGLANVAYDTARLARVSFWHALGEGFAKRLTRQFNPASLLPNPYLAEHAGVGARDWLLRHPWFEDAGDLAPGKRVHLWMLLDCLNLFYDFRRSLTAPTVFPLISQPIIETVLAIPSYILTRDGIDRRLAREAFADSLPETILQRRVKGAMDGYYAKVCAANAPLIRSSLLDGEIAARGLLDRTRIERDLPKGGDPADGSEGDLLKLFAAEMWARGWKDPGVLSAPAWRRA